jgi:hypothetical protein
MTWPCLVAAGRGGHGVGKPAHDLRTFISTIDKFRAAFGIATRSVHHNVATPCNAAHVILKSEDWPLNVVPIAEARARRRTGFMAKMRGSYRRP